MILDALPTTGAPAGAGIFIVLANGVTVRDLVIRNARSNGNLAGHGIQSTNTSNLLIENVKTPDIRHLISGRILFTASSKFSAIQSGGRGHFARWYSYSPRP